MSYAGAGGSSGGGGASEGWDDEDELAPQSLPETVIVGELPEEEPFPWLVLLGVVAIVGVTVWRATR
jgi:hypothetical protein